MNQSIIKAASGVFGIVGFLIVGSILFSFAQNHANAKRLYPDLINPLAGNVELAFNSQDRVEVLGAAGEGGIDYTHASNWFPTADESSRFAARGEISFYTISIPELEIQSAAVAIGGEELADSLIQYPGTALPGKQGNAVIFGHSILPAFYNPNNYISIFSKIDTLKKGSEITVNFDGIAYTYLVKEMFRVKPTDVFILDQNDTGYFLSLVTCFPMGDPRKPERLVVKAELKT